MTPYIRSHGPYGVSQSSAAIDMVAGSVVAGDLIVLLGCKDVGSNFTASSGFTVEPEAAIGSFVGALAWKWATAADSGASFMMNAAGGGGSNDIGHGHAVVFTDVVSSANPIKNLTARVGNGNWAATASYAADPGGQFVYSAFLQGNNVIISKNSMTAAGWTMVSSFTTVVGNDGQELHLSRTAPGSGGVIVPASAGYGTASPWVNFTFGLDGMS